MKSVTQAAQEACIAFAPLSVWPIYQPRFIDCIVAYENDDLANANLRDVREFARLWQAMAAEAAFLLADVIAALDVELAA